MTYLHSFLVKILIFILQGYRKYLSPLLPDACRFHPSCSAYFIDALKKHGLFIGLIMGCARLLKCNPFFKGGFDPVP